MRGAALGHAERVGAGVVHGAGAGTAPTHRAHWSNHQLSETDNSARRWLQPHQQQQIIWAVATNIVVGSGRLNAARQWSKAYSPLLAQVVG